MSASPGDGIRAHARTRSLSPQMKIGFQYRISVTRSPSVFCINTVRNLWKQFINRVAIFLPQMPLYCTVLRVWSFISKNVLITRIVEERRFVVRDTRLL